MFQTNDGEKVKAYFVLSTFSSKIVPFVRKCGKKYSVIKKDGLHFVHLYFLNYKWYVNDLHKI